MRFKNLLLTSISLVLIGCGGGGDKSSIKVEDGILSDKNLPAIVEFYRDKYDIPALAGISTDRDSILEQGFSGRKIHNIDRDVTSYEQWHLGSITKSMTALLSGYFVDRGLISWSSTIGDIFPELRGVSNDKFLSITLVNLLSHSSGIESEDDEAFEDYWDSSDSLVSQRLDFIYENANYQLNHEIGIFEYSNINYLIVGAMIDRVGGDSFENLMQSHIFTPLGMQNSKIGEGGDIDGAWGHKYILGDWIAFNPTVTDSADNFPMISPAGSNTFTTLYDMSLYLRELLSALDGEGTLLSKESYQKIFTPIVATNWGADYALGFMVNDKIVTHSGSNDRWYSLFILDRELKKAFFASTNSFKGENSGKAVSKLVDTMVNRVKK